MQQATPFAPLLCSHRAQPDVEAMVREFAHRRGDDGLQELERSLIRILHTVKGFQQARRMTRQRRLQRKRPVPAQPTSNTHAAKGRSLEQMPEEPQKAEAEARESRAELAPAPANGRCESPFAAAAALSRPFA